VQAHSYPSQLSYGKQLFAFLDMFSQSTECLETSLLFISVTVRGPKYVPALTIDTSDVAHCKETQIYISCIQSKQLLLHFPLHK